MTIGEIIKKYREERNMSQRQFASFCGVSNGYISMLEEGKNPKTQEPIIPSISMLKKISTGMAITLNDLIGMIDDMEVDISRISDFTSTPSNIYPVELRKFPLLGEIACGKPIFAEEDHESYIMASRDIKADFCLIAKGDSMIGARINDGDVVFIHEQPMVENGEIAAVIINGEATLKRWYYYPEKQKLLLAPANEKYEPFIYVGEELNEIRCLGKAVCFMSNL